MAGLARVGFPEPGPEFMFTQKIAPATGQAAQAGEGGGRGDGLTNPPSPKPKRPKPVPVVTVRVPTAVPSPPGGIKEFYDKERAKEKRREKRETQRSLGIPPSRGSVQPDYKAVPPESRGKQLLKATGHYEAKKASAGKATRLKLSRPLPQKESRKDKKPAQDLEAKGRRELGAVGRAR